MRFDALMTFIAAPTVTGDFVESLTVRSVAVSLPAMLSMERYAAPSKVIFPSPTVTIISAPLTTVEYVPFVIDSVSSSLKP